ncbi:hypothetical protein AAH678_27625 [Sodalis endosymbiont of Spalangia cameroni]|uniref:hypothetical protein n=1 Tax=Sodalis praecaptivus TaxID=1239307 RepID=UPI0031F797CD
MLVAFADHQDGPLFLLRPGPRSRFFLQGTVLYHDSQSQTAQEIYRSDTREAAMALLHALYLARKQRRTFSVKTGGAVLLALLLSAAVYLGINAARESKASFSAAIPTEKSSTGPMLAPALTTQPVAPATPLSKALAPQTDTGVPVLEKRARSLYKAAASGRYTVTLSSGHLRTLYVFADPVCPHCRDIEPTLEALTRDYNVEIFPVSVIGKHASSEKIIPVLCASPETRARLWQSLFSPDAGMAVGEPPPPRLSDCAEAEHAVAINDLAFGYYQLPGTPQLLTDDGRDVPFAALTSDETLARFMNAAVEETAYGQ